MKYMTKKNNWFRTHFEKLYKMFILCIYMPASNYANVEYENVLNTLQAALDTYSEQGTVVIAGDMNAELINLAGIGNTFRDKSLSNFVKDNEMFSLGLQPTRQGPFYTFKTAEKMLDHILIHKCYADIINETHILDDDLFGVSDHLPIFTSINVQFESLRENQRTDKIAWHKINENFTELYQNDITVALQNIHFQHIDTFYNINNNKISQLYPPQSKI